MRAHVLPTRTLLRRALLYGLLWGVTYTASEALVLPFGAAGSREQLQSFAPILFTEMLSGIIFAVTTLLLEPRLDGPGKIALMVALLATTASAATQLSWVIVRVLGVPLDLGPPMREGLPSWDHFFYVLWMNLLYGGLFVVACVLLMRAERTRGVLARAQIARNRTEALLDDAQLDALHGQVDLAFLLRAMGAVQARYATDPAAADRLLDQLVTFLRFAMPVLRSGSSTLHAELRLAQAYAALGIEVDPTRPGWRLEVIGLLPPLPFPPLLLTPLLDQLAGVGGRLRVTGDAASVALAFDANGPIELPAALLYGLQVSLQTTFGAAFAVQRTSSSLTLRLDTPAFVAATAAQSHPPAIPADPRTDPQFCLSGALP